MKKVSLVFAVPDDAFEGIEKKLYTNSPDRVAFILDKVSCEGRIEVKDIEY